MTIPSPFLSIDSSCDHALQTTTTKLSQAGLLAVQTFNLNTARRGMYNCSCPNHGTEACDCQMIILLVYGQSAEPATLILHGKDGKTWVSVTEDPLHNTDKNLVDRIRQSLECQVTAGNRAPSV